MSSTYPNFPGKHAEEPFFTPDQLFEYARRTGRLRDFEPPSAVVLCYQRSLWLHALGTRGIDRRSLSLYRTLAPLPDTDGRVAIIGDFGIGAPAAAAVLEELAALGVRTFVSLGTAGTLQHACAIGDVVVCERAIRDEGVSHHYLPPGKYSEPDAALTAALHDALGGTRGTSWTIDTPYRETVAEARHYQGEGVLCVEMEAAALFAVAQRLEVALGSAFVISDSLADLVWDPQFSSDATERGLEAVFEKVVSLLTSYH